MNRNYRWKNNESAPPMMALPIGDPYAPYMNRNYRWKNNESAPPMMALFSAT